MSDLIEALRKSATVLTDTSMMGAQFPAWLLNELEQAAKLHEKSIAALSVQPDAGSGGDARAQFEAWAGGLCLPLPLEYSNEHDVYTWPRTRCAWLAWQAAYLKAIKINDNKSTRPTGG